MKRLILAALVASTFGAGSAFAQNTPGAKMDSRLERQRAERTKSESAESLIHQRARYLAQQRTARLEAYKWMGYSPTRPTVRSGAFATDLNPGLHGTYYGYASGWSTGW